MVARNVSNNLADYRCWNKGGQNQENFQSHGRERKLETDEDITGKQGKLDVALFSKNSGASSVSTILLAYQKKTTNL
jgi:hypothetical protein